MKKILFPLILFVNTVSLYAQNVFFIKGYAVDQNNKNPIEFATVTLLNAHDSTLIKADFTDTTGYFQLGSLNYGSYVLTISSIEYQKIFKGPLKLSEEKPSIDMGKIALLNDTKLLNEVVITGEKLAVERIGNTTVLNVASSSLYKTATNTLDVLKKAPGLQVSGDGEILIRNSITPTLFIDGKPSNLQGDEVANYLSGLSPDQIESIQIINNPSGQYDATYKAIIDLKLKRDKNLGWNGSLSQAITRNTFWSPNSQLSLSYKAKKYSLSLQSGYYNQRRLYTNEDFQNLRYGGKLNSKTEIPLNRKIFNNLLNFDYNISHENKAGLQVMFNQRKELNSAISNVNLTSSENTVNQFNTYNTEDNTSKRVIINPYYEHKGIKGEWSMMYSWSVYNSDENQQISNVELPSNLSFDRQNGNQSKNVNTHTAQADFSRTVGKGKFTYGLKAAYISTKNYIKYDTLNRVTGIFVNNANQSNDFLYKEYINAAYINYAFAIKAWQYEFGIRAENTTTNAHLITTDSTIKRQYFYILPNFSLNTSIGEDQTIGLAYSARLTRPDFNTLNPFQFYINQYSYLVGNPFLLASVSHNVVLTYSFKDLNISLSASRNLNDINQLPFYDPVTNISYYKYSNIRSSGNAGIDFSHNISPTKWWVIQTNLGVYYLQSTIQYLENTYSVNKPYAYIQGSQVFKLSPFTIDLSYNYNSRNYSALFLGSSTSQIGLGFQKTLIDKKLTAKLRFDDIFYGYIPWGEFLHKDIYDWKNYQKYDTRSITFQLVYNFGQSTYKAKQRGKTEEEQRAN